MKKLLILASLFLFCPGIANAQYVKILGTAETSSKISTSGVLSTNTTEKTLPGATITILNSDNTNATIYSDAAGTSKSNPYSASSTDATFDFFIRPGAVYSVRISGTSGGVSITPFTRSLYTAPGTLGLTQVLCVGTNDTTLLSTASAAGGTIVIPKGITCASNSQTISAALNVQNGGLLKPLNSQTVTLTGPQNDDPWQRFSNALAGQGTISFTGNNSLVQVRPEWWGGIPVASTTTQMSAFQRAVDSGMAVQLATTQTGTGYSLNNAITPLMLNNPTYSTATIRGAGQNATLVTCTSTAKPCIQIDYVYPGGAPSVYLSDFYMRGAAGPAPVTVVPGNYGIYVPGFHDGVEHSISNLHIRNVQGDFFGDSFIFIKGRTSSVSIINPIINDIGNYGIFISDDVNQAAAPQDVTIDGGSLQGTPGSGSIGGIAAIGVSHAIGSLTIKDIDIELREGQTKPTLYLEQVHGALILGTTLASIVSSLSVGDADAHLGPGCYGNVFVGLLDNASQGLNNIHLTATTHDNVFIGSKFSNKVTGPGYLVVEDAGSVNNLFLPSLIDASSYQSGHITFPGNRWANNALVIANTSKFSIAPKTNQTYAAAMTIDVTISNHVVAASNTTSATVTMTPSAAGSAGDFLYIDTVADSSGTVTTTFASTFHSSGTQATTASHFSSITFKSDGTRWIEQSRTTNLAFLRPLYLPTKYDALEAMQ